MMLGQAEAERNQPMRSRLNPREASVRRRKALERWPRLWLCSSWRHRAERRLELHRRHLAKRANQTAIIWEGDDPSQSKHITYKQLHDEVCRMANILRTRNVKKGDRVTIYLPMIPEAAYAMLACARIGAIHSVVFGGFSPDSLAQSINDAKSKIIITADEGLRGSKKVPLKANVEALAKTGPVDWVVVVKRTGGAVDMKPSRDLWYHDAAKMVSTECPVEHMHAEDPLFILYTSGSTGRPKGALHTSGGYPPIGPCEMATKRQPSGANG
jgi:acetyl-CoA synthetase